MQMNVVIEPFVSVYFSNFNGSYAITSDVVVELSLMKELKDLLLYHPDLHSKFYSMFDSRDFG